jgi:Tfp pilus assembly protein PilO
MPVSLIPAKQRSYLSLCGFGVIGAFFLAISYLPYLHQRAVLRADIVQQNQQIAAIAAQTRQLKDGNAQIQLLGDKVKDYDRLVMTNQNLGSFLEQLSHELTAAGLPNAAVQAMAPVALGKCQQLPIQIHAVGTAAQCHDFLQRLETLPRKSSISHLNLEADAGMTGKVSMELTLSIYFLKP